MEKDIDMEKDNSKRNQIGCTKCSCNTRRASKQASYATDPPLLDDLVQWNKDVIDDDDPSFFW